MADARVPLLPASGHEPRPEPDDPSYAAWLERVVISPEGVDRMLLRELLHQTPEERLWRLQDYVDTFEGAS